MWVRRRAAQRTVAPTTNPWASASSSPANGTATRSTPPSAATATPAPNARASSCGSGLPLARPLCLAQRGHFCPTAVVTMHRVQIGSPQFEQVSRVSTLGWFTQVGATFVWSAVMP